MRTLVLAALLHQVVSFVAPPPVRVAPSLGLKLATRATPDEDATAAEAEDAVAAVEDDATPKRRPLRNLWRRLRRRKAEEVAEPEPGQGLGGLFLGELGLALLGTAWSCGVCVGSAAAANVS